MLKDKNIDGVKELDEELSDVSGGYVKAGKRRADFRDSFMGINYDNCNTENCYKVYNNKTKAFEADFKSKEEADRFDKYINGK